MFSGVDELIDRDDDESNVYKCRIFNQLLDHLLQRNDNDAISKICDLAQRAVDQLNRRTDMKSAAAKSRLYLCLMQEGMKNIPDTELEMYMSFHQKYGKSWEMPHLQSLACILL